MAEVIAGVAIGAGIMALIWMTVHLFQRNRELQRAMGDMQERLKVLEATARTRMPHEAKAELMDALSVISRFLEEREIDDVFLKNIAGHINNAIEVGAIRQGMAGREKP